MSAGSVAVNQELLELQVRVTALKWNWGEVLGMGTTSASRFAVSGTSNPTTPGLGRSVSSFGWTIGAGAGVLFNLSGPWILGFDLQWERREPAPIIIAGTRRLTGPRDTLLFGKLGFGVMF